MEIALVMGCVGTEERLITWEEESTLFSLMCMRVFRDTWVWTESLGIAEKIYFISKKLYTILVSSKLKLNWISYQKNMVIHAWIVLVFTGISCWIG
jgi:hypothetical protein